MSEKLDSSDNLVDAVKKMKINDIEYELNTATASDAKVDLASKPDKVTHTSNRIIDQKLLNSRTIGEIPVLPPPTNPRIGTIELAP